MDMVRWRNLPHPPTILIKTLLLTKLLLRSREGKRSILFLIYVIKEILFLLKLQILYQIHTIMRNSLNFLTLYLLSRCTVVRRTVDPHVLAYV